MKNYRYEITVLLLPVNAEIRKKEFIAIDGVVECALCI